jgi:hypothetical protein
MTKQHVVNDGHAYKYFTMMLNMADDDLDPFQYRLLAHYVRAAGQGGTYDKSIRETAKATKMSTVKAQKARDELERLGYITIKRPTPQQARKGDTVEVHILDRWAENINRYAKGVLNITQHTAEAVSDVTQLPVSEITQDTREAVLNITRYKKNTKEQKKKKSLTESEQFQIRLKTVTGIMLIILAKMERGFDPAFHQPETYLTLALLKKYIPLAEQLTFLKMTSQQFLGLWGEIEPEYRRNGWTIAIKTIEEKAPSYMLRQNKKQEKILPPLTVVTPAPSTEPELTADQRIALAEQSRIDFLTVRPAVGE